MIRLNTARLAAEKPIHTQKQGQSASKSNKQAQYVQLAYLEKCQFFFQSFTWLKRFLLIFIYSSITLSIYLLIFFFELSY